MDLPVSLRRFRCNADGVAAVEFALIAAPFFALLFAILETALVFMAQQALQTATTETARLIMTGQAQNQNMTASQFQQALCTNATTLFSCSGLYVNVQTFTSFSSMTQMNPLQNGTFVTSNMNFMPGGPGEIVLVQAFYQWPVWLAPLGFNLSNMSGDSRLLMATAVFRNEPY